MQTVAQYLIVGLLLTRMVVLLDGDVRKATPHDRLRGVLGTFLYGAIMLVLYTLAGAVSQIW